MRTDAEPRQTLAEALAGFFCGADFAGRSEPVLDRMALHVLDTLACALGGSGADSSRAVVAALGLRGGEATAIGAGGATSPADAALINGAAAHALELDDDDRVSVMHPGAVVVPAALALAEASGADGRLLLRSVLAGYEVANRVGDVFRGRLYDNGFHPTAVCGVFGAAAAGAILLRLDPVGFARALGVAGTQAAGLMEWRTDGSWIKRLHPGRSAQSGVLAALLAREGFTAPATILEGEYGAFAALSHRGAVDAGALTRGLGSTWRALGTAIKPYPCCRFAHGAIDLAIEAHAESAGGPPVEAAVKLYRTGVLTYHPRPLNTVEAQFNVPYLVATALLGGGVGLADLTERAVRRDDVLALAARVRVIEDDAFSAAYPDAYLTSLDVTFADGRRSRLHSDCPSGDPEAARYRDDPGAFSRETVAKARRLLGECGFDDRADELVETVLSLRRAADSRKLGAILRPRGARHSESSRMSSNK